MSIAYLVQGLRNNTLVAGKTTAMRLVTAPWNALGAAAVQATVVRPDGSVTNLVWSSSQVVVAAKGGNRLQPRDWALPGRGHAGVWHEWRARGWARTGSKGGTLFG
ncbi:MAG: hypothetical protein ACREC9_12860 [Methylocella sp.]